jgi:hypothetical protein
MLPRPKAAGISALLEENTTRPYSLIGTFPVFMIPQRRIFKVPMTTTVPVAYSFDRRFTFRSLRFRYLVHFASVARPGIPVSHLWTFDPSPLPRQRTHWPMKQAGHRVGRLFIKSWRSGINRKSCGGQSWGGGLCVKTGS